MDKTNTTYEELLEQYSGDTSFVLQLIEETKDKTEQDRLIDSAEQYYADKYNCDKHDVFWGSVKFRRGYWENVIFPYTVIVGNLSARGCNFSAPDLKAVVGELDLTGAFVNIKSLQNVKHLILNDATIKDCNMDMKVEKLTCNGKCRGYKKPKATTQQQKDKGL